MPTRQFLLGAAAVSGQVFAPSRKSRMALEELREFAELRFRAADNELLSSVVLGAQVLLIAIVHLLGI